MNKKIAIVALLLVVCLLVLSGCGSYEQISYPNQDRISVRYKLPNTYFNIRVKYVNAEREEKNLDFKYSGENNFPYFKGEYIYFVAAKEMKVNIYGISYVQDKDGNWVIKETKIATLRF